MQLILRLTKTAIKSLTCVNQNVTKALVYEMTMCGLAEICNVSKAFLTIGIVKATFNSNLKNRQRILHRKVKISCQPQRKHYLFQLSDTYSKKMYFL